MKPERLVDDLDDVIERDDWTVALRFSEDEWRLGLATGGYTSMIDARLPGGNWLIMGKEQMKDGSWILKLRDYGKLIVNPPPPLAD